VFSFKHPDILSFDTEGHERYIEVKTTALGEQTPLYITSAELEFAHLLASAKMQHQRPTYRQRARVGD
jgi:Domain of unknown function (DUF3883)